MRYFFFLFLICILLTNCVLKQESTCFLTGEVIDRDSKSLILIKQTEDARYCGVTIPIDSLGHFKYLLKYPVIEAYELIFKDEHDRGSWRPILFFPDNDTIRFSLYQEEKFDSNKVIGGELSGRMEEFNKQMINNPITNEIEYCYQQRDSLGQIGKINTEYSTQISEKLDSLFTAGFNWQVKYFWKENNLFGYSKLRKIK